MIVKHIAFIALLAALAVLSSCATRSSSLNREPHPTSSLGFDRQFLQDKVHYYEEESNLAQLCLQKAERLELRQFCTVLLASQDSYSADIRNWLRSWYGVSSSDSKEEHSAEDYRRLMADKNAAETWTFDRMFLAATRLYHHHGIDDLHACVTSASRAELTQWCRNTLPAEIKEMNQMSVWICAWFDDCIERPMRE